MFVIMPFFYFFKRWGIVIISNVKIVNQNKNKIKKLQRKKKKDDPNSPAARVANHSAGFSSIFPALG